MEQDLGVQKNYQSFRHKQLLCFVLGRPDNGHHKPFSLCLLHLFLSKCQIPSGSERRGGRNGDAEKLLLWQERSCVIIHKYHNCNFHIYL